MATLRDCLVNADFVATQSVMMRVASKLQDSPADQVVAGCGLLLLLLCEQFDEGVRGTLEIVERQIREAEEKYPENIRAAREYIRNEIKEGGA